jgi:hypothetical protein
MRSLHSVTGAPQTALDFGPALEPEQAEAEQRQYPERPQHHAVHRCVPIALSIA